MSIIDSLVSGIQSVFEEPEVARYVTLADSVGGFTIPDPTSGDSDHHIQGIQAPGLIDGSFPVLFYRTRHTGTPQFSVRVNSRTLIVHTLTQDGPPQTWHHIVPPGTLMLQDNEVTFAASGDGTVTFSDAVIFYKSNQLTVAVPPVLRP